MNNITLRDFSFKWTSLIIFFNFEINIHKKILEKFFENKIGINLINTNLEEVIKIMWKDEKNKG